MAAERIYGMRRELAAKLTDRHFARRPELEARYGAAGRAKCSQDAEYHLAYFSQAMALGVADLFADYVAWAASMLASRGIPRDDLRADVMELDALLADELSDAQASAQALLAPALARLSMPVDEPAPALSPNARRYLDAALRDGPVAASQLIDELLALGLSVACIYVDVLQPAMHEVGRLWQANRISVAEEHYSTAVTQRIVTRLHSDAFTRGGGRASVVVACVVDELHELGARMTCDLIELDGFGAYYLGAGMPPGAIADFVYLRKARVLGLSASIAPHLREVRRTIDLIRTDERLPDVKIIVGGSVFNAVPDLWRRIGADGFARDAAAARAEVLRLAG